MQRAFILVTVGSFTIRLLWVERELENADRLRDELAAAGVAEVGSCRTVPEALAIVQKGCVDVVAVDAALLDPEAVTLLCEIGRVPVVALAPRDDAGQAASLVSEGVEDVLVLRDLAPGALVRGLSLAIRRHAVAGRAVQSAKKAAADRLTAQSRRIATAAHDIDNPTAYMLANQAMLDEDLAKLDLVFAYLRGHVAEERDPQRRTRLDEILAREPIDRILQDMREMYADNAVGLGRIRAVANELRVVRRAGDDDPASQASGTYRTSRAQVLLIDDEPALLRVYQRMLEPMHEVTVAHGGSEGLAILKKRSDFDAVICDLTMPDIDGPTIHAAVRDATPGLAARFVFCTGGAFTASAREFMASVPNLFVDKPITRDKLVGAIERVRCEGRDELFAESAPSSR